MKKAKTILAYLGFIAIIIGGASGLPDQEWFAAAFVTAGLVALSIACVCGRKND